MTEKQIKLDRSVTGITNIAKDFLMEAYDMELEIPISINGRLSRTMGRYMYTHRNESVGMDFAKYFVEHADDELFVKVIKHECIHYALHRRGDPFADGHPFFETELKKHESLTTGSVKLPHPQKVHYWHCGCKTHKTSVKHKKGRICLKCRGRLEFVETKEEIR